MPSSPDNWNDELQGILKAYGTRLLRQVAARLCKPRSQWPASELIERCLGTLGNTPVLDRRLRELSPASRLVLALMAHSRQPRWRVGHLVEMVVALGQGDGLAPVLDLLAAGLIFPDAAGQREHSVDDFAAWVARGDAYRPPRVFAPPLVLERLLAGGSPWLEVELPAALQLPSGPLSHSGVREADGLEWPLRLSALWQQVSAAPLRRTLQQDLFKRDLDRMRQDALLAAPSPDALIELPDPGLLTVALAWMLGLLEERDTDLVAGGFDDAWRDGPTLIARLWSVLPRLEGWNPARGWQVESGASNPYPSVYLLALLLLARLPADHWATTADVESWIAAHHPFWSGGAEETTNGPPRRAKAAKLGLDVFLLGLAYPLRLVKAAKGPEGDFHVRMSDFGRWVLALADQPPLLPQFAQTLLVQPNLEILAYRQGLTPDLILRLGRIATWKSLGPACTLQLEPGSVYRALEQGESMESIVQLLESRGMKAVPMPVLEALRTWSNKRQRITIFPTAALFEFPGPSELNEALARGLSAIRLTDRLAVAPSEKEIDYRHFRLTGTRDYCLPPDQCVEVLPDGVTLSVDLARSDLLLESEVQRFAELVAGPHPTGRRLYRLTPAATQAARRNGLSVAALETWFQERTGTPLPPASRLLFSGADSPPVHLRRQLVVHEPAPEMADGLEQWPATRGLIQSRLGPNTLTVLEKDVDALLTHCRQIGIQLRSE